VTEETNLRVRSAAARLDYWPNEAARSLNTSRTQALGVLLPDLYGEFYSEVIRGIDHAARHEHYQVLVSSSHADTEALIAVARSMRGRVDGLIIMAPDEVTAVAIDKLTGSFPIVLLNPRFDISNCMTISIANFEGAHAMIQHLLHMGHRSIAMIKGPQGNIDSEERYRGYCAALRQGGLEPESSLLLQGDFTESSGYRSAQKILRRKPRPTAVFAANDYMAVGLMSALGAAGVRVPQDVAVTGFDDIAIAQYLTPPLTTVRVDAYGLGERAVRRWISMGGNNGTSKAAHEVIPAVLVVRNSCGTSKALSIDLRPRRGGRGSVPTDDVHSDSAARKIRGASSIASGLKMGGGERE
jgi:LacI family transcriptional regulator